MNKLVYLFVFQLIAVFATVIGLPQFGHSAGTCTVTPTNYTYKYVVTVVCTADAADGSFPSTPFAGSVTDGAVNNGNAIDDYLQGRLGWWLTNVIVRPGSPSPTSTSDVTLLDADGYDVLGGAGTDRFASDADFYPLNSDANNRYYPVISDLTHELAGNSVNSAVITVEYIFGR